MAFPSYECEQCVGQEAWQGCYCAYYGASTPNGGREWWRAILQDALILDEEGLMYGDE